MRRILFMTACFLACIPLQAFACSCMMQPTSERYASSQVVFLGKAVKYVTSDEDTGKTLIRFTVLESWKGAQGTTEDIGVPSRNNSCSIEILIGRRYLIYAYAAEDGSLSTHLCSGTSLETSATTDLEYLRSLPKKEVGSRFSDVPTDYPYAEAIAAMKEKRVVSGYPDGSFRPERAISRAELAQVLAEKFLPHDAIWRNQAEYAFTNTDLPFSDLGEREWYNLPIRRLFRAGMIQGYRDGTFRPAQSVTVAEATKMIVEALQLSSSDTGAEWYERYIRAAGDREALPPSIRSLDSQITRGEVLEMLWRLSENRRGRDSLQADELLNKKCIQSEDSSLKGVDLRRVRETWLGWYNDVRSTQDLPRYSYDPNLTRSAVIWTKRAAAKGYIDHIRDGTQASYSYPAVLKWFSDLGLEFKNRNGITFTENIGRGPYRCTQADCTDELIAAIRTTFDFYLSEKEQSYRPHYNAIVNPSFSMTGLGIAVEGGQYYLTAHFGTKYISNPPRLCSVDGL